MSMKKWVPPEGMSHWTEIWPEEPRGIVALLARTAPARKLRELALGALWPAGKARRSPSLVGWKAARFATTAEAVGGTPQTPAMGKERTVLAMRAGPPEGPGALRVSAARH